MVLSYEALADEVTPDAIIGQTINAVEVPRVALGDPYERLRSGAAAGEAQTGA
jgi:hypothetical protein